MKEKIKYAETSTELNMEELKKELAKLEEEEKKLKHQKEELAKKEKVSVFSFITKIL